MGRTLAASVAVPHPDTQVVHSFAAGQVPPDWAAEQITNPAAWIAEPTVFKRLASLGATAEELEGLRAAWALLDDDEKADAADNDLTDAELIEQLAELRALAVEHGVTLAQALKGAIGENEQTEPVKPLDDWRKDELIDKLDELRAAGVEITVEPPGNKPEIIEALRPHLES